MRLVAALSVLAWLLAACSGSNRVEGVIPSWANTPPAHDHAAIVALNGRGHHPAVSPRAHGDAAGTDADGDVPVSPATIVIVAVTADPHIDLRHLELLGLGRNAAAK